MPHGRLSVGLHGWSTQLTQIRWQPWLQRLPPLLTMLFVILLARALADATWLAALPPEAASSAVDTASTAQVGTDTGAPRLATLVQHHLFGVAQQAPAPQQAPIEAKETGLRLTLRGTLAAGENRPALAVIADAKGEEKVYARGEQITAGASLYAVYPDRVILERNGSFETLSLPRDEIPEGAVQTYDAPVEADTRRVTANQQLRELREDLVSDPQRVWQEVRIEPVLAEDGGIKGYRVNHNDPRVMQALGLTPEDVVTSINGLPLDDPTVLYGLLDELNSQADLRLQVERDGQTRELIVNM